MCFIEKSVNQLAADFVAAAVALEDLIASPVSTELELAIAMRHSIDCMARIQKKLKIQAETLEVASHYAI